jgi:TetR/AcrR family transcriptional regulator, copper-responsive repressor
MTRSRGRPRSFDADVTLRQVYKIFRSNGFAATSLDDIARATGLNRPSLYAAFGDKRTMYLAAIRLVQDSVADSADRLDAAGLGLRATLDAWLKGSVEAYLTGDNGPGGCLAICTAVAESVSDADIRSSLEQVLRLVDERVAKWYERAGLSDPLGRARLVAAVMHSMSIRARAGQPKEVLNAMAEDALTYLVPSKC